MTRVLYRGVTCSIEGCEEPANCRSYCLHHYNMHYQRGDPLAEPRRNPSWTPGEDAALLGLIVPGRRVYNGDYEMLAARLGRSVVACRSRLHKLRRRAA